MIRAVRSDHPTFRDVHFTSGFNVILAERTKESTKQDSCNGLGKTTLIEIIHFCLGSDFRQSPRLRKPELRDWTFSIDIDILGKLYTIHRSTANPQRVQIDGDYSTWSVETHRNLLDGVTIDVSDLNIALGWLLFGIDSQASEAPYGPTFRAVVQYFIRHGAAAFMNPFVVRAGQLQWQMQVYNSFLLGLNWEHARRWQGLREKQGMLDNLKRAARSGLMDGYVGTLGELEAEKVQTLEQLRSMKAQLDSFMVHPQYHEIEARANALTSSIHRLANDNVSDQQTIAFYESSIVQESPADVELLQRMYKAAGVELPDVALRRLADVEQFHESIIANRRRFLEDETRRLKDAIVSRDRRIASMSEERSRLMRILQEHGALEEHTALQGRHADIVVQLGTIEERIGNLKKFQQGQSTLRMEREQLLMDAQADYEEREPIREQAIALFNSNSRALYDAPGTLIINVGSNGFRFDVEIQRSDSEGIEQMKVFCYDLMLSQRWNVAPRHPGFLVHDSRLFADVDKRQVAHALQLAARESAERGFQYICCLNSDSLPENDEFEGDFALDDFIVHRLTDATESGSLLGFRF